MKADLHNHLGSNGANPGFDETIDLVYSKLGNNSAFGIANSDDFRYEKFVGQKGKYERVSLDKGRAVYVPEKKVLVVKCQEVFTKQGHILAISAPYGRNIFSKNARHAIREAKDFDASLSAVHPFYQEGIGNFLIRNENLISQFSSWEGYNGSAEFYLPKVLPRDANKKSIDFYFENILANPDLNIGISSATDGHSVNVVGKCYTELQFDENFMNNNFAEELDKSLRKVKCLNNRCMNSNQIDAGIHAFNMAVKTLQGKR